MKPGRRAHLYHPEVEDQHAVEDLLKLIDADPNRTALIAMPEATNDDEIDQLEDRFRAVYELAKTKRPGLCVNVLHAAFAPTSHDDTEDHRIVCAVHEHRWAGGECVNGCGIPHDEYYANHPGKP